MKIFRSKTIISKVGYDKDHTYIIKVETREDKIKDVGPPYEESRQKVISNRKKGKTYMTILKNEKGNWNKGASVDIIKVNGKEFIRTDGNQTESDNLGELPEF